MVRRLKKTKKTSVQPRWRRGPPNQPGWWLVMESTLDTVAWYVNWDRDGGGLRDYLRFSDGMNSEPVAKYDQQWPVVRSYGPIPKPRKAKKRFS